MLIWCVGEQGSGSNGVKPILFKLKLVPGEAGALCYFKIFITTSPSKWKRSN
jgi:hypothetical protein